MTVEIIMGDLLMPAMCGIPKNDVLGHRGNVCQTTSQREPLCERFGKMRHLEFEGSTNPLDAEECLSSIETILDFMELNDREKVICATFVLKREPGICGN